MQYKRIIKLNKSLVRGLVKRYVVVSVCSVAGCIAASAQAPNVFMNQQPGLEVEGSAQPQGEGVTQLLGEINGNISKLTEVQTQATTTKVGVLFKKTVVITPVLNHEANTSFGAISLGQLGNNIGSNSDAIEGHKIAPEFHNLVIDTHCDNLVNMQQSNQSFMKWLFSSPSLSQNSHGTAGSSATSLPAILRSDSLCSSYLLRFRAEANKAYTQNLGSNSFVGVGSNDANDINDKRRKFKAYEDARNKIFAADSVPINYNTHNVSSSSSLLNALSGKGGHSSHFRNSILKFCTNMVQGDVTSPGFQSTDLPSLSAAWSSCKTASDIRRQCNLRDTGDPYLTKGLLKAQLKDAYFNDMKKANATELLRVVLLNGSINNLLAIKRNEKLQELVDQNNALLVVQAAALSKPTKS